MMANKSFWLSKTWLLKLYRFSTFAASPFLGIFLAWRTHKGKEDPARRHERLGFAGFDRPPGPLAWLHGASVGETISLLPIIEKLTRQGLNVLVTSGTVTSAALLNSRLPARAFHQYLPLDVPLYMQRFLNHWQPDLAMIAESEIWPNMLAEIKQRNIPALLVNARMSERSFARWQRFPDIARAIVQNFDLCLAQSAADGERLERLGATRVFVAGNIKYDVPAPPANPATVATLSAIIGERPVWVAASTHPGEDELVIRAHHLLAHERPDILTIIIPRHPERGPEIAALAASHGLVAGLRSQGALPDRHESVHIVDTIGELGLFYRLSAIAFIGGSLVPRGGQNPIEPAKLGTAILHGPYVHNFTDAYKAFDRLDQAGVPGACLVENASSLAGAVHALLAQPAHARAMTRVAAQTVTDLGGAVDITMQAIAPYILHTHLTIQ